MTLQRSTFQFEDRVDCLKAIEAQLNRAARSHRLTRVELRLSSLARFPIAMGNARAALTRLLRERGLTRVAVSVRPFDLPLDDALGEHQLILIESPKAPAWWAKLGHWLLSRLKQRLSMLGSSQRAKNTANVAKDDLSTKTPDSSKKALSPLEAGDLIKRAALVELRNWRAQSGIVLEVERIHVRIRSRALYEVAVPLLPSTAGVFLKWIGKVGQRNDLVAIDGITMRLEELPEVSGEEVGTLLVGDGDISIELTMVAGESPSFEGGTDLPAGV
jgi:hypothetical protein